MIIDRKKGQKIFLWVKNGILSTTYNLVRVISIQIKGNQNLFVDKMFDYDDKIFFWTNSRSIINS